MAASPKTPDLNNLNSLIQLGREGEARSEILRTAREPKIPNSLRLDLARLARRVSLPQLGLRLLQPIVRPPDSKVTDASPAELCEYAANLTQAGGPEEALKILSNPKASQDPFAPLFTGFALTAVWNYKDSIPYFKEFAHSSAPTDYLRLVGLANLLAAYCHERDFEKTHKLGEDILREARAQNLKLLSANTLMTLSEAHIEEGHWKEAEILLNEASKNTVSSKGRDSFFISKWKAVLNLMKNKADFGSITSLNLIRDEALKRGSWETLRDCDFHEARARQNEDLFLKLYFGTPFEHYRARLLNQSPWRSTQLPFTFFYSPSLHKTLPQKIFSTNDLFSKKKNLRGGDLLSRLFKALTSDLYRPQNLVQLYNQVYPGQFYHPKSSPVTMREAMKRLRRELVIEKIPIQILEKNTRYSLEAKSQCVLAISSSNIQSTDDLALKRLRRLQVVFGLNLFSSGDAAQVWNCSKRTALNWLKDPLVLKHLRISGERALTRYQII